MTTAEALGVAEVARDLVEMGDVFEARCLLEEIPWRHDWGCPACGAMGRFVDYALRFDPQPDIRDRGVPGSPCHERGLVKCWVCSGVGKRTVHRLPSYHGTGEPASTHVERCTECYGSGQREQDVDMVVPHESRLTARRA